MPNWCQNVIILKHNDPEVLKKIVNRPQGMNILESLYPCPEELMNPELTSWSGDPKEEDARFELRQKMKEKYGYASWYDWNMANWGTKWDLCNPEITQDDDNTLRITCETAWGPPTGAYTRLVRDGFDVKAYYHEPGMVFAGIWTNGADDSYNGWSSSHEAAAMLPQELDDMFSVSEGLAEWEEEALRDEELYQWTVEGAKARNDA